MSYLIRSAEQKDIPVIYRFICLLEETDFNFILFESICVKNLCNEDLIYLVAESHTDGIIGVISCHTQNLLHHCGRVAEIQELFVEEHFRGLGTGNSL
ncbi:MAG: GNAT family N-acetyltransferase, partial [Bacteroidota bacterium]